MEKQLTPIELKILNHLKPRMDLSPENKLRWRQLQIGYDGESKFHQIIKQNLHEHYLSLFNLLLKVDGSLFQIDCLIICQNSLYMYEVKNYTGDYYMQNNRWYVVKSKREIRNPLLQLERSHYLLKELVKKYASRLSVKSYIVFVNQAFTLYQAPLNQSIIFPGQIKRHFKALHRHEGHPINRKRLQNLAKWILSQQVERDFSNLPEYSLDSLQKGIFCKQCQGKMKTYNRSYLICHSCKQQEKIDEAILNNIDQFITLFPEERITTNKIYQWCGKILSRKIILRVLKENYELMRRGRYSFFNKSK